MPASFPRFILRATLLAICTSAIAGCASTTTARPSPFPGAPAPTRTPPPPPPAPAPLPPDVPATSLAAPATTPGIPPNISNLINTALSFRGVNYQLGGEDPKHGFDCSGFVYYVYGLYHVSLPRTVAEQYQIGKKTSLQKIQAGDLIFFATTGGGASHVAIAMNNEEFVHAPSGFGAVRIERLSNTYWHDRFVGARRVLP